VQRRDVVRIRHQHATVASQLTLLLTCS
jgi:hypothetical protein